MPDRLHRFLFEHADVRGEVVQLDGVFREVVGRTRHPKPVQRLIGEGLAAAALLAATLKFRGSLSLQLQSSGPLSLLLVQAGSQGGLRAMARTNGTVPADVPLGAQARDGSLAITIDPEGAGERYQGIVDLGEESLAAALERYFRESEQLATRVWLSAGEGRAAGMLLQRLPGEHGGDPDAWSRASHLAETVTPGELRALEPGELIRRLFHEEDIRLFDPVPFRFRCRCSRERVAAMLHGLGAGEMREILAEQGQVEVHCDFCNEPYRFDAVDIEDLFADPATRAPDSPARH